ncbi:MAG: FAD-dependent oxidoreductase [Candidatus Margulisiibacteriota bacterium]|jgi:thioredoxin reductase (NADPH)
MQEETLTEIKKITPKNLELFDVVIIGAGPAGMCSALCAARAKLKILIIEKSLPGGELSTAAKIDNYIGFSNINGIHLSEIMEKHIFKYPISYTCEIVDDIENQDNVKIIKTDLGNTYKAKTIIIATGLEPKKLNEPFEKQFFGRGLSYCAPCDAELYQGKIVAVLGGGNCACYAAEFLAPYVDKIYLIHQSNSLKAVASLKEKILDNPKIIPMWNSKVSDIFGISSVEKIKVVNLSNEQYTWIDVKGVFVYVGRVPSKQIFNLNITTDEKGFIYTDEYMRTNISGIYAAGDVRIKQVRQIATAVSDGMIAAINVERDLASRI